MTTIYISYNHTSYVDTLTQVHSKKSAAINIDSSGWKLPTGIMKFAGTISPKSARALRKFVKETDKVYE
jgi:hypothetical protein